MSLKLINVMKMLWNAPNHPNSYPYEEYYI
jgi:hypothetical protein